MHVHGPLRELAEALKHALMLRENWKYITMGGQCCSYDKHD